MYKQINKAAARKLYAAHVPFIIVPCNMRPDSMFAVHMNPEWTKMYDSFDFLYNSFSYYNCNNEAGRYPRFYVEE